LTPRNLTSSLKIIDPFKDGWIVGINERVSSYNGPPEKKKAIPILFALFRMNEQTNQSLVIRAE